MLNDRLDAAVAAFLVCLVSLIPVGVNFGMGTSAFRAQSRRVKEAQFVATRFAARKYEAQSVLPNPARVLDEIFDESAYSRFLARRGMTSSATAYASSFAKLSRVGSQPRCC